MGLFSRSQYSILKAIRKDRQRLFSLQDTAAKQFKILQAGPVTTEREKERAIEWLHFWGWSDEKIQQKLSANK